MARDFYPRREGQIVSFTGNFRRQIEAQPEVYGLSIEQCAQYALTQQAFVEAYRRAIDPTTATRPVRMARDHSRAALEEATRFLARIVRAHPGVTTEMRIALQLSREDPGAGGAAIGRPLQRPTVIVRSVSGREIRIELRDDANKRRKPDGVSGAVLFVRHADEPSPKLSDWDFMEMTTRARETLRFGPEIPPGAKIWVMAQWFSPRGERGPGSMPVCAYLQGGLAIAAIESRRAA